MKLGELATIKTGLVLARKVAGEDAKSKHEYKQINLKSINADGTIAVAELDDYCSAEDLGDNYLTQSGDIIIRLTAPNTAVFITDEWVNLVVSSHFCIIRMAKPNLLAEYVHWYLNSDFVKTEIAKNIYGSSFAGIKPSFLSELEIKVPSPDVQEMIAKIYALSRKEQFLLDELKTEKAKLYKKILNDQYKKMKRNGVKK